MVAAGRTKKVEKQTARAGNDLEVTISSAQNASKENDALVIYFKGTNVRSIFHSCDDPKHFEVDKNNSSDAALQKEADAIAKRYWRRILFLTKNDDPKQNRNYNTPIILEVSSDYNKIDENKKDEPALLRTRSALGVLRNAAGSDNLVAFMNNIEDLNSIIDDERNLHNHCQPFFYDTSPYRRPNAQFDFLNAASKPDLNQILFERDIADERRLILIAVTNDKPPGSFLSVNYKGRWYSVLERDEISKRNLELVSEINTIQAVPPQSAPLTPTINVGGMR